MNEQDIINLILGEPDGDFHGTVPSEGRRQQFNRLRGHAGALMRHTHGSLTIQEPTETRSSASLTLDVRKHFSMLMELSDSISLSSFGSRLRIGCTVCGLWEK